MHSPQLLSLLNLTATPNAPNRHAAWGFFVFNNAALAASTFCLEIGSNALIADID
ncbi:MAG: hypothetical protein ABSB70_23065 [Candidatus Velthaea sp.]|jgi:acetoin utilization deacetylase AcuC-like enzyme